MKDIRYKIQDTRYSDTKSISYLISHISYLGNYLWFYLVFCHPGRTANVVVLVQNHIIALRQSGKVGVDRPAGAIGFHDKRYQPSQI
jgi:hypothetical protein